MKRLALIALVCSTSAIADLDLAIRECSRTTQNSMEYASCLSRQSETMDKKVDAAYRAALARVGKEDVRRRIEIDQKAWLATREGQCRAKAEEVQGTGMGIAYSQCLITQSSERLRQLSTP